MSTVARKAPKVKSKVAPVFSLALSIDGTVYQVEPIPAGEFGTKAFRLSKKSNAGEVYDLVRDHDGLVVCDCPSYEVTFAGTCDTCKHGHALVALGLLDKPAFEARIQPEDCAPVALQVPAVEVPAPARVGAFAWAYRITGRYAGVATAAQLAFAREILADDSLLGRLVEPIGPSEKELDAALAAAPCCSAEAAPCLACSAAAPAPEADPLAEWVRPARKSFLRVLDAGPRPVKPLAPPDGSRFTVVEMIEAQAAYLRGQGSAPFTLMADALTRLAMDFKATGATCVADYQDRIEVMKAELNDRRLYDAYADGYDAAQQEAAREYC